MLRSRLDSCVILQVRRLRNSIEIANMWELHDQGDERTEVFHHTRCGDALLLTTLWQIELHVL